jgi:hypothetical protein
MTKNDICLYTIDLLKGKDQLTKELDGGIRSGDKELIRNILTERMDELKEQSRPTEAASVKEVLDDLDRVFT